jgi:hypothetical protein
MYGALIRNVQYPGDASMNTRAIAFLAGGLLLAATTFAQRPPENVSARRHPNLAAAQRLVDQAFAKITAAQRANEFDLAGHAERAKGLLDQANRELKLAAETSNRR